MKKIYLLAAALAALVSCTSDDFTGEKEGPIGTSGAPLSFNLNVPSITRADKAGEDAAEDLNYQFYVYAIKNESTDGAGNVGAGNLVFNNYVVKWVENTANSTTSNTKDWEYVGYTLTPKEQAKVTANSGDVAQTIKYWDYAANDYTFYAFSALPSDIENDKIAVAKVQNQKTTDDPAHTVYDNGYTVTLEAGADLDHLFFAERRPITDKSQHDPTQTNKYGGNVTFRFHNMATKVRVGMYETIPGYSVTINKFTVAEDQADPAFDDMNEDITTNFAANLQNCVSGTAGTFTVTYVSSGETQNYPTASFTGTKAKVLTLGEELKAGVTIGETATNATFDQDEKAYTSVFPNETNSQNLKLKVSYTLTAPITGETTVISNKTAEIPAKYLQWKPGYAYTYLFKITDDDLYPITFDAVEVVAEDGSAEYITTVTDPSITTYAKASNVVGDNEYKSGSNIYVVVNNGVALTVGTNANLYTAEVEAGAAQGITEETVKNAIANGSSGYDAGTVLVAGTLLDGYYTESAGVYTECTASTYADGATTYYKPATKVVTDANGKKLAVKAVTGLAAITEIDDDDTADGVAITINGAMFTPAAPTYTRIPDGTVLPAGTYYTKDDGTTTGTISESKTISSSDNYYYKTSNAGFYVFEYKDGSDKLHYKVIKVVD